MPDMNPIGHVECIVETPDAKTKIFVDAYPGFITVGGQAITAENAVRLARLLLTAATEVAK